MPREAKRGFACSDSSDHHGPPSCGCEGSRVIWTGVHTKAIPVDSQMKSSSPSTPSEIEVHALCSEAEYEACILLQLEIWGDDVRETVPSAILQVTQKVGGVAAGAFEFDGTLAGFVFGLTGIVNGKPAHWSHLLAVRPDRRDRGIGRLLKYYQRDYLRKIGVNTIYWTFDPMESRNAHLNLNRLGAEVVEYVPHMYGETASARTDLGIGTDQFIVRWDFDSAAGPKSAPDIEGAVILTAPTGDNAATPALPAHPEGSTVLVEIPGDIQKVKLELPDLAAAYREYTRLAFRHYLGLAYEVRGFVPGNRGGNSFYVLEPTAQESESR